MTQIIKECIKAVEHSQDLFYFLPDPCTPLNLSATVSCSLKAVSLTWDGRAEQYVVSADTGVRSISFNTSTTTVHMSELICGQNYSLTVTPIDQHCTGSSSALTSVQTCTCYLYTTFRG